MFNCHICNKNLKTEHTLSIHIHTIHIKLVETNCLTCNKLFIPKPSTKGKFCSLSCSTIHKNLNKIKKHSSKKEQNKFHYKRIWNGGIPIFRLNKNNTLYIKNWKTFIVGEYVHVYPNQCEHCEKITYSSVRNKRYCEEHLEYYINKQKYYKFTFNIKKYSDLFDLELIKNIGWNNTKDKIDGLSKDHKISIYDAIKNNYNPYYIKHPLNCEILLQSHNSIKNKKSSITYEELIKLVDEYDGSRLQI